MERSCKTACNNQIILDDRTIEHLRAHPEAETLLAEAIGKVILPDEFILHTEVIFDRIIGQSSCVPIDRNAPVMFAVRIGRNMPTRTIVGADMIDARSFVVVAQKSKSTGVWRLITGYRGSKTPREPHNRIFMHLRSKWDFLQALSFWSTHALVWEKETMGAPYESSWKEELTKIHHPAVKWAW